MENELEAFWPSFAKFPSLCILATHINRRQETVSMAIYNKNGPFCLESN